MNPRRLFHSECVSECAGVLAERYGASVEKARLAGLLHDVMKNAPANEQLALMPDITPLELLNTKVWHQISGEAFLRQNGIVTDEEILGAVRWHTTGKAGMTLLEKSYTLRILSLRTEIIMMWRSCGGSPISALSTPFSTPPDTR